ncbi:MAG: hypothetical protein E7524_01160 [Ruminococcaceae bacterium]|nr:hypothetical protein [Oscillospiraceae bacterium]
MISSKFRLSNRVLAIVLSVLMLVAMLPVGLFTMALDESNPSVITTDINTKTFNVGTTTEFTFTTTGNGDAGTMVLGSFEFLDANGNDAKYAIDSLQYLEVQSGNWFEFYGDFGPAATGFELQAAATTSTFKVTFNKAGTYTVTGFVKEFGTENRLCSVVADVTVYGTSTLTTTIADSHYVVGRQKEFTFTTVANTDAGAMVLGSFEFLDGEGNDAASAVEKLEYLEVQSGNWFEFYGDFGPATTGFPLTDATSRFRVTFAKDGNYVVNACMKTFAEGTVLCAVTKDITVKAQAVLTTDVDTKEFVYNKATEFTFTTTANGDADTMVFGTFELADSEGNDASSAIAKLEYKESKDGNWYPFTGDFGPVGTGFPLTDATSNFRVTFNKTGSFKLTASMVTADDRAVICSKTDDITVINADIVIDDITLSIADKDADGNADRFVFTENKLYTVEELISVTGTENGDEILYSLTGQDGTFLPADQFKLIEDSAITATPAGNYNIYVMIKRQYHNNAILVPKPITVTIEKATIAEGDITIKGYSATYDKEEHNIVDSISSIDSRDTFTFAKPNETTFDNEIKVTNVAESGKYIARVYRDDNYETLDIEFDVVIEKAQLIVYFEDTEDVTYKEDNYFKYEIEKICGIDENGDEFLADDVTHTPIFSTDSTFASVAADGTVTYTSVGDITVKATLNDVYDNYKVTNGTMDSYKVNVYNVNPPAWLVTGPDKYTANSIDWYSGKSNVIIAENDNDAKWYIIESSNALGQNGWADTIEKTAEQMYTDVKIAFKNAAGEITALIDVPTFAIDNSAPTIPDKGIKFEQKNGTTFANVLNFLTFGLFFNETLEVTVTAEDFIDTNVAGSGTYKYALTFYDENGTEVKATDEQTSNVFKIDYDELENFKGTVKITLRDNVDNVETYDITVDNSNLVEINEEIEFMLENDAPVIGDITPANGSIHKNDFSFKFSISDIIDGKEYHSDINSVKVTVNGETVLKTDYNMAMSQDDYELPVDILARGINGVGLTNWNNGVLEIKVNAYDNAGNKAVEKTSVVYTDQTAPVIKGFDFSLTNNIDVEKEDGIFKAVSVEDYGFYFKQDVVVTITAEDLVDSDETKASGVKSITYKAVDINGEVKYEGTQNGDKAEFTIKAEENFKGQIYAYATDNVGNTPNDCVDCLDDKVIKTGDYKGFVHPNGSIVESAKKHNDTSDIAIDAPDKVDTQNNAFKFNYKGTAESIDKTKDYDDTQKVPLYSYADGIVFKVNVKDTYSGIRSVKWTVFEGEDGAVAIEKTVKVNNEGILEGDKDEWTIVPDEENDTNLVYNITGELTVKGNHNNMALLIELTDRAGNTSYDYYVFGIDATAPVIKVEYNDDKAKNDTEYTDHFSTDRTATITITERNFRAEDVVFAITNTDKVIPAIDLTDSKVWTEKVDKNDLDKTTYTATISYTADGDYTFEISYTDNAGNKNKDVDYGKSIAPTKFTIDKTLPTLTVEYDNNSAQNGNYYKAQRIATITIVEHNFDANRVKIIGTTTEAAYPTLSAWTDNGDTHTATITYADDSKYTLDIEFNDKAGNSIADFAVQEFTVDKTNPTLAISGIVDNSANADEGNIGFVVTATDTNYNGFAPVLTAVVMNEGSFEIKELTIGSTEDIANGQRYTVTNIDTDGIYSITCTLVDKAGNAYSEVILEDANGKTYIEKRAAGTKLVTFSVNRNGSVFTLDTYTQDLVKEYYVKNVEKEVTIIEINADPIKEHSVTLNGKALVENTDYTVKLANGEGSWYKYSYVLNTKLFEKEGEYNIIVSSRDKANNEAFSDIKDVTVKFVVDRTAPIVTVAGLKKDGRYQIDKQKVTLVPSDDGGSLKSLIVRTVDKDGKKIKELLNLSGEALEEALAAGSITFELGQGLYQNVQIICEDHAGNISGSTDNDVYDNVSISTNGFMIFWANRGLRWGCIAGVALLAAAIVIFIILKKRKANS